MTGPRSRRIDVTINDGGVLFDNRYLERPPSWTASDWHEFWTDVREDRSYARGYAEGRQDERDETLRRYGEEAA